jgi:hypothetical protein
MHLEHRMMLLIHSFSPHEYTFTSFLDLLKDTKETQIEYTFTSFLNLLKDTKKTPSRVYF